MADDKYCIVFNVVHHQFNYKSSQSYFQVNSPSLPSPLTINTVPHLCQASWGKFSKKTLAGWFALFLQDTNEHKHTDNINIWFIALLLFFFRFFFIVFFLLLLCHCLFFCVQLSKVWWLRWPYGLAPHLHSGFKRRFYGHLLITLLIFTSDI